MLPFFRQRQKKEETLRSYMVLENGSSLLEELMACFGGRYENPIRCFRAQQLISATNNFNPRFDMTNRGRMFQGFLEGKQILVKKFSDKDISPSTSAIRDIVVSSQMSHLKNILKLRGCCLEFKFPALVYEHAGTELLSDLLQHPDNEKLLTWRNRLHIAKGIANAIAYLHNAFPTPIIYRNLKPSKVIIEKDGTPKLFDFSLSIRIPPGESQVKDVIMGTWGFVDPGYVESGIVTEKADVYSFGVLLLMLLTGEEFMCKNQGGEKIDIVDYVKYHSEQDQFNQILDPNIWEEEKVKQEKQLQGLLDLAMKCTQKRREDRPDMIQVAKELCKMEKCAALSGLIETKVECR